MREELFYLSVLLFLIAGMYYNGLDSAFPESKSEIIDCRNSSYTCEGSKIDTRISKCSESWRPWDYYSQLNCTFTSTNTDSISLVSDAANYVDTQRAYSKYNTSHFARTEEDPWDLEFLPSGDPIWTNKGGSVYYKEENEVKNLKELEVIERGENGLLGLELHPDFRNNRHLYLYHSYKILDTETLLDGKNIIKQRISRFKMINGSLKNQKTILEVPGSLYHSGGRLEFGPDNKLYITTGEAYMEYEAVNPDFLGGKILRINADGTIPEDNPFENSSIYSMGHRNPQGVAWNPKTSTMYNTEHGPWRYDELNQIQPGANYGWAHKKCGEKFKKSISYWDNIPVPAAYNHSRDPIHCWKNYTMAPSGATFVNDTQNPWHGDLFIAGLRGSHVARFEFNDDRIVNHEVFYISNKEERISLRLRDVEYFNGSLYVLGDKDGIVRITPS